MRVLSQLTCSQCGWHAVCGASEMIQWLRQAQMARRDKAPEPELLGELFRAAAARFACPQCGAAGLAAVDTDDGDDESWGMARACEACGQAIARERLEALPDARLCTACQGKRDRGQPIEDAEYCPRCGNIMKLVVSRRGVTRYTMVCPRCRS